MTPEETQQRIDQHVALFGQMADTMEELSKIARDLNAMLAARPPAPDVAEEPRLIDSIKNKVCVGRWSWAQLLNEQLIDSIKNKVCVAYDVPLAAMTSRDRQAKFVRARQVAMWLVRKHAGKNIVQTSEEFGLNHGTVSYACRMVDNLLHCDPKEAQRIGLLDLDIARLKAER